MTSHKGSDVMKVPKLEKAALLTCQDRKGPSGSDWQGNSTVVSDGVHSGIGLCHVYAPPFHFSPSSILVLHPNLEAEAVYVLVCLFC
jgi:hypothetical protein